MVKQLEYSGFNSIENLPLVLNKLNAKKVLLVTGKKSFETSGARTKTERLLSGFAFSRFFDFSNNPQKEDIERGVRLLKDNSYDSIIAIGGGSSIDMAKCINFFSSTKLTIEECIEKNFSCEINIKIPIIAVPTTVGSGSESTMFGVMYFNNKKYSVSHNGLLPKAIMLDPAFAVNLPSSVIAATGVDALSQSIESFWSVNSTLESIEYSSRALSLIVKNLKPSVVGKNSDAISNMLLGSNLAGKAINISKTTAPHALSYAMTINYNIAHGQAVGLTLGEFYFFNARADEKNLKDPRGILHHKNVFTEMNKILKVQDETGARFKIKTLMQEIGLKTTLSSLGINKHEDYELFVNSVDRERLANNPRAISNEDLFNILTEIK